MRKERFVGQFVQYPPDVIISTTTVYDGAESFRFASVASNNSSQPTDCWMDGRTKLSVETAALRLERKLLSSYTSIM